MEKLEPIWDKDLLGIIGVMCKECGVVLPRDTKECPFCKMDLQKTNDLAFRVGVLLGSLQDEEVNAWAAAKGFGHEEMENLKKGLSELAKVFYK